MRALPVALGGLRLRLSWVATGAVKSRSEAAALFIREGLRLRKSELETLKDALNEVQQAQERLKKRAAEVFQGRSESSAEADSRRGAEAQREGEEEEGRL